MAVVCLDPFGGNGAAINIGDSAAFSKLNAKLKSMPNISVIRYTW